MMFDTTKTGSIEREKVHIFLETLGHTYDDTELQEMLESEDPEGMSSILYIIYT